MKKSFNIRAILVTCSLLLPVLTQAAPWKFVAYGDTRSDAAAHESVLRSIQTNSSDAKFILHVGDVVESGTSSTDWTTWYNSVKTSLTGYDPITDTRTPPYYIAVPGNHDALPAGLGNWNTYLPRQNALYGNQGRFSTFDYDNARFILIDGYQAYDPGTTQYAMLTTAAHDNPKTWLFVMWHQPILSYNSNHPATESTLGEKFGKVLYDNGCDVLFVGHNHIYIRNQKIAFDDSTNTTARLYPPLDPVHGIAQVLSGNGGAPLYSVNVPGNSYTAQVAYPPLAQPGGFFGYTELVVNGNTMTLRHVRASDNAVVDTATYTANFKPNQTPTVTATVTPTRTITPTKTASVTASPYQSPTITPTTVIIRLEPGKQVVAFPNPGKDSVKFAWEDASASLVNIRILNMSGEPIATIEQENPGNSVAWNCKGMATGVYMYQVTITTTSGKKTYPTQKLAIVNN